jgi:hypothetical protein
MKKLSLLSILYFLSLGVYSQNSDSTIQTIQNNAISSRHFSLGAHFGTVGLGVDAKVSLSKRIFLRLGYSSMPINYSALTDIGGLKSNTALKTNFDNLNLFAEWQPFSKCGFRLVGGAAYFINGMVSTTLSPTDKYTVGNITLNPEDIGKFPPLLVLRVGLCGAHQQV